MLKSLLVFYLALVSVAAPAAESAHAWLAKMNASARNLNYKGVFVYLHENQMEAMRVVHLVAKGSMRERLYSLNGEAREVIRDERQVWCYLPGKKMGVHEYRRSTDKSFPSIVPSQVEVLDQNYDLQLGGKGRIAERDTQLIIVKPKDGYRYGYNLWADRDTGLLLKADLVDESGRAVEQYMFTQVAIGVDIDETALAPLTAKGDLIWHGDGAGHSPPVDNIDSGWLVSEAPAGYRLTTSLVRRLPLRDMPVQHMVYSDGIAAISVFIEGLKTDGKKPIRGLSRMGAVHAFGTVVDGYQVMVVGEVPAATVDMVGRSVMRKH